MLGWWIIHAWKHTASAVGGPRFLRWSCGLGRGPLRQGSKGPCFQDCQRVAKECIKQVPWDNNESQMIPHFLHVNWHDTDSLWCISFLPHYECRIQLDSFSILSESTYHLKVRTQKLYPYSGETEIRFEKTKQRSVRMWLRAFTTFDVMQIGCILLRSPWEQIAWEMP